MLETASVLSEFADEVERHCELGDADPLNQLVNNRLLATRLPEWIEQNAMTEARNIITLMKKMDKRLPGVWYAYEGLSEFCHPNYLGTHMFSVLHPERDTLELFETEQLKVYNHAMSGLTALAIIEHDVDRIDRALPRVIELSPTPSE